MGTTENPALRSFLLVTGLLLAGFTQAYAQTDFARIKRKKLYPIHIDTLQEAIIIIEKRSALLVLKQSDVKEYLSELDTTDPGNVLINKCLSTLIDGQQRKVKLVDLWEGYTSEERSRMPGSRKHNRTDEQYLAHLHDPVAHLILTGKFMVISLVSLQEVKKGLKTRMAKGIMGAKYRQFLLPGGITFWTIIISLGE